MKPIFLVGYMGCGKSTLGRKLAQRLAVPYFDTDDMAEQYEGASAVDIFRYEGEERFRTLEREAIRQVVDMGDACVVSTGGGLPAWGDNMELLNAAGHTVYLRRTPEQIARRLSPYGRQKRPKLRGLNDEELIAFMTRNMAEREPFYMKARTVVECGPLGDAELLDHLLHEIRDGE